jgi:hypothetical protein
MTWIEGESGDGAARSPVTAIGFRPRLDERRAIETIPLERVPGPKMTRVKLPNGSDYYPLTFHFVAPA